MLQDSVSAANAGKNANFGENSTMKHDSTSENRNEIVVTGKAACAGCEFGVTPIGAPDELGLAITTSDGKIYVIEDAHSRWPEIYKGRFGGSRLSVRGEVIKTEGRFAWVKPSTLTSH